MISQAKTVTLSIAPGAIESIHGQGENFHLVFAPVDMQLKWPGGEFVTYPQGAGVDNLPGGQSFNRLEVRNPSTGTITVVVYVGGPLYRDNRSALIEPRTELDAWANNSLAAGTGQNFSGVPTGLRMRRKAINVTNLDASGNLQVRDAAGHIGLTVFPQTSITLPISESVTIHNATAGAIACSISEIWWTL